MQVLNRRALGHHGKAMLLAVASFVQLLTADAYSRYTSYYPNGNNLYA